MDPHTFITCIIAVTILTLTPGVDTMLVIRNSGRGGWSDGATTSLGICSGLFVHATLSAMGISIILLKTAWAFTLLKYAGAAYLIWLGICSWRQAAAGAALSPPVNLQTSVHPFQISRSLREGFLSNVLNPKTILFYMAFLPQFIDPTKTPLQQSLFIASIHFCIGMIYQCGLAAMVTKAKQLIKGGTIGRVLNGLCGTILVYIGLRLAATK
ncbi:MAG: RhtB (resistance to homoserine/threonine) family protein [Desulforhopalus sp.]|jgi:RhtB (resistance to homoserine/threonine) family protein